MPYRAFYNCQSTEERVDSANAYDIELDGAANIVVDILRTEGDFFGLTDTAGVALQFMQEADSAWMEIPAPSEGGSYGAHVPPTEAIEHWLTEAAEPLDDGSVTYPSRRSCLIKR